ncbi:restriction endonuclease subunit S [Methylobacter sp. YRD-M1]|uniref:restriction endonuclease subunit S n=1 Tax=Methylobacter sp. YRD-M1 TaxID=2911520 RepID=UPI00227BF05A|nr:restriction endonuclease subunit S [Methylobacter sp. YRD-M1]WAK04520.1 restriction endonuclease subunit S [Methylobacter sp. YRD-M1]
MRVPKGFQQIPGLSICPSEWKVVQADDICSKITKGTTPPKSDIVKDSDIPFLRVNNLTFEGRLNTDNEVLFVSESAHRGFLARSIAYPNDILMNIVGPPLGKIVLLPDTFDEYNLNQAIIIYRLEQEKVNKAYFLNYLKSNYAQYWLRSRSKKTSGQQNLTIELCKELPVPLPEIYEQQKIAQILSTWDKVIEKLEALIAAKQKRKKALMQQLLTGKKRFAVSEEEWKEVRLGDVGTISSAGVDKKIVSGEPEVRLLNFLDVFRRSFLFNKEIEHVVTAPIAKIKKCDIKKGDIFFTPSSETREELAISAVAMEDMPGVVYSYHIVRFRLHADWDLKFRAYVFQSEGFCRQAYFLGDGSGQRYVISQDNFKNMTVKVPSYSEQKMIGSVLCSADKEIETHQKQLVALKEQKKGLMQQLLTGKKRVQVKVEEAA